MPDGSREFSFFEDTEITVDMVNISTPTIPMITFIWKAVTGFDSFEKVLMTPLH